jgi:hypothetical protein
MKKRAREIPPRARVPVVSWECKVLKMAAKAKLSGQIIDDGATRIGLQTPQIEMPISWVDMTSNHWSVLVKEQINR